MAGDALTDGERGLALGKLLLAPGQPRLALGEDHLGLLLEGSLLPPDPILGVLQRLDTLLHRLAKAAGVVIVAALRLLVLVRFGFRVAHAGLPLRCG